LKLQSVKFKGYSCFRDEWAGFDVIKPINVIIGRNNAGKSHLLDLITQIRKTKPGCEYQFSCVLNDEDKKQCIRNPAVLEGYPEDIEVTFQCVAPANDMEFITRIPVVSVTHPRLSNIRQMGQWDSLSGGHNPLQKVCGDMTCRLCGRIEADRDIRPEFDKAELVLDQNGAGATNIIQRYINNSKLQTDKIEVTLLDGLNDIFTGHAEFTRITVQEDDVIQEGQSKRSAKWEVYLVEKHKGGIQLSRSGSGLKTVLLVLLNLLIKPEMPNTNGVKPESKKWVFLFEELENNLHPALLRRLFQYLETYVRKNDAIVFLTTHSSVALDYFGTSESAQIIHVTHDGKTARTRTVPGHLDRLDVISELGAKPSDLLQANGIIWIEGPSDRIYLNRWIQLYSEGRFREGRDYQCVMYGGSLLAHDQFAPTDTAIEALVNLFQVNPNIIVVCDSDRTAATGDGAKLKPRVDRIKSEIEKMSLDRHHLWITRAKEIENYLPGSVLAAVYSLDILPSPGEHERFFPSEDKAHRQCYIRKHLGQQMVHKVELARRAVDYMTKDLMEPRFDLDAEMNRIVKMIQHWNT
jgi:hypothetical protein